MDRDAAWKLVRQHVKNKNLRKHMLATEAVMRRLARHFNADEEQWGLVGLLHDIDYDQTANDPDQHSILAAEILAAEGLEPEAVYAVKVHNHQHGLPRLSLLDKALYCTDPITGLIVAAALISKEKRLSAIDSQFVLNRFGEKSFARGANRETILACCEIGLELEQFVDLALEAMQGIAEDLGL
jgi:putative nucleotidyltransferase with HDIG domain